MHTEDNNTTETPHLLSGFRSPSPRLRTFNLLSSPTKVTINNVPNYPKSSPAIEDAASCQKEFAELSSQLSGLLKDLSQIYTEIGYSKQDIEKNEKSLFDLVSHTFDKFLSDSRAYKQKLTEENSRMVGILRQVLNTINDPSGTRTIPDLYQRNLVLKDTREGTTLLSLKKCLECSMDTVLKDYRERLLKYLQHSQTLNLLTLRVDGFPIPDNITFPSLEHTVKILKAFEQHSATIDVYEILVSERKRLLENESLNNLSDERFIQMAQLSNKLKSEVTRRLTTLKETCQSIASLWEELEIDHKSEYFMISERVMNYADSDCNTEDLDISTALITELTHQLDELKNLRTERLQLLDDYAQKCEILWIKLKENPQDFKNAHKSLSMANIEAYESEYQRLQLKKKEFLQEFVLDARTRIVELWDQLCFSEDEREKFTPFKEDTFTDDLLTKHEDEIVRLTVIFESFRPILELVQEFTGLLEDRANLEESTKDSSRLLSRNSHKILMEEEKTRKRLTRQLPRVVGELKTKMQEFETMNGPLTFLGEEFLQQLDEEKKKLESKGRRVLSGSRSTAPSRAASAAPSRAVSRAPSAAPSRVTSRAPSAAASRAPSRVPSRLPSRQPSRSASPVKATSVTSARQPLTSQGVHKPLRRPLTTKPTLGVSKSCILPPLTSPIRESNLSITSDMMKDRRQVRPPTTLTRSHSTFQPQLSRLPETNGSPRRAAGRVSPLKSDSRSNLPLPKKRSAKIMTSPLKSLSRETDYEDSENTAPEQMSSDQDDDDGDTYSNWRKEQLKKLNAARQIANDMNWETETF